MADEQRRQEQDTGIPGKDPIVVPDAPDRKLDFDPFGKPDIKPDVTIKKAWNSGDLKKPE